jgi:GTP cyclohydrolase II
VSAGSFEVRLRRSVLLVGRRPVVLRQGTFTACFFRDLARGEGAMALVLGDPSATRPRADPLPVRVHSSCVTSECLLGLDCDCAEQLDEAFGRMAAAGRGVLYYLMQEGRGAGLTAKARDRMLVQASGRRLNTFEAYAELGLPPDLRRYDVIAPMTRMLDVRGPVRLLTNNPDKSAAVSKALAEAGVEIAEIEPVRGAVSTFNADYLGAKHESSHSLGLGVAPESSHSLGLGVAPESSHSLGVHVTPESRNALEPLDPTVGVTPPAAVPVLPPMLLCGAPSHVLTASYLLPVALDDAVEWFRLGVVYDGRAARETVVLVRPDVPIAEGVGRGTGREETDAAVSMSLVDRLPRSCSTGHDALRARLRELRADRIRCVRVAFDDRDRVSG